jgi:hypothetical protein
MLLPNGKRAIIDIRKLRDYCLNPDNPRGSGKARVFARALGITAKDAAELRSKLLEIAGSAEALIGELDVYGQRYTIDFEMETEVGKALIRSGWIVLRNESGPRFTTCYVKKRKK